MAGFRNIRAWVDVAETGANWISSFRKTPQTSAITIAGQWYDYSGSTGNPVPNYYASVPFTSARLVGDEGIYHGPSVAPAKKYVHRLTAMTGAAGATTTTSQQQTVLLCDYLLYYPFFDLDAVGETQDCINTVTLPRYVSGEGVKMALIAQAPTVGGGQFYVTYTNQNGEAGRVTPTHYMAAAAPTGSLVHAGGAATGVMPWMTLQSGDTGVQSVQSVSITVAHGGLGVIVLFVPVFCLWVREECRRTTSSVLESFGSAAEKEMWRHTSCGFPIEDGAYLNFIARAGAGSVAGSQLVGTLETVWG